MDIKPIRNYADYQAALEMIVPFVNEEPLPGSADADRFEVLLTLIQVYEFKNYPFIPLDSIDAIKLRKRQSILPDIEEPAFIFDGPPMDLPTYVCR